MQNLKRQSGMTMWSLLYVLGTLAFFLFLLFKMWPTYMTDFKIRSALDSLSRESDVSTMSIAGIREAMRKRLEIDSADDFDLKDTLTVEPRGNIKIIHIAYDATVPMAFNISALISFDPRVEVRGGQ